MTLADVASKLYEKKQEIEELKTRLKDLSSQYDELEAELLEEMLHIGANRLDFDGMGSFSISTRKFYKIQDKDALLEYLHDQGDDDILTVQHQTLNAYIKEKISQAEEQGDEDFLVPGTEFTTKSKISIRRN